MVDPLGKFVAGALPSIYYISPCCRHLHPGEQLLMPVQIATIDDVRAAALPVLRHRIVPNFHAEAENVNAPELGRRLLADVPEDEKT